MQQNENAQTTSSLSDPEEGFVSSPDGTLHYLDWGGDGTQAHFLHANGFCAGIYSPMVDHFRDVIHIFASDIRGHGDSAAECRVPPFIKYSI